jgi:hypothetical protein
VPILVDPDVMTSAGIAPEEDLRNSQPPQISPLGDGSQSATSSSSAGSPAPTAPKPVASPEESGRLSIFEDFLSKLEKDEPPSEPDDPDKPETK